MTAQGDNIGETSNTLRFDGRVAIVTGAGRGLGREHALLLASRGAKVLVNDLGTTSDMTGSDAGPAAQVVAEIEAAGGQAAPNFDTVATREGAEAIVADAFSRWGRVDIVINNAGGAADPVAISDLKEADLRRFIDTHLLGAFFIIGAAWPIMIEQKYGRVLNTSSPGAMGQGGMHAYAAAKAGLVGLTGALAVDGGIHNIKANAIWPNAFTRLLDRMPEGEFRSWFQNSLRPTQVSAVAAALVHEDVPFSGEIISMVAGRAARVFWAGVRGFRDIAITPELFMEHIGEIMDTSEFVVMKEGAGELVFLGEDAPPGGGGWLESTAIGANN